MGSAAMLIRRLRRHLTRTQARAGWLIALLCLVVFDRYPAHWSSATSVREAALVLFSVALGAVFLPELSSNLWQIKPDEVKGLIPHDKIRDLETSLVVAQTSEEEWARHILDSALRPLLEAGRRPHTIAGDLSYTAQIHTNEVIVFGNERYLVNRVETSVRSRRVLPPPRNHPVYWVSVARDPVALRAEFAEEACLFREVLELGTHLSPSEWRAAAEANTSARIVLDGLTVDATTSAPPGLPDVATPEGVVRWYFASADIARAAVEEERRTITLALDYPLSTNRLSVIFGAYYAMGSTSILVRVYDKSENLRIEHDHFFGAALGTAQVDISSAAKPGLCKQVSVITSDSTLLWPGSGITVSWSEISANADGRNESLGITTGL